MLTASCWAAATTLVQFPWRSIRFRIEIRSQCGRRERIKKTRCVNSGKIGFPIWIPYTDPFLVPGVSGRGGCPNCSLGIEVRNSADSTSGGTWDVLTSHRGDTLAYKPSVTAKKIAAMLLSGNSRHRLTHLQITSQFCQFIPLCLSRRKQSRHKGFCYRSTVTSN